MIKNYLPATVNGVVLFSLGETNLLGAGTMNKFSQTMNVEVVIHDLYNFFSSN